MGYYIDTGSNLNKVSYLVSHFGAERISKPNAQDFSEYAELGQAIVCVVDNVLFEGAAFVYSLSELEHFTDINDTRPKEWIILPWQLVINLTGFKK